MSKDGDSKVIGHKYGTFFETIWAMGKQTVDRRGCPRGVMVKALDRRMEVSVFELQSRYYVHFRINTLGIIGINSTTSILLEG